MHKKMNFLAVIPARGGSKRLPKKNILSLCGKPLIAWTIEAAKKSKYITDIIVSTDDKEIAEISKMYGITTPFMRPPYLSNDTSTSIDVVKHAISFYKENLGKEFDYVLLLQPTSPLRTSEDIDAAIQLLMEKKADSIISMSKCEHSPLWTNILPLDNNINNFIREDIQNVRSQDLSTYYRYNGAIYLSKVVRLIKENLFSFKTNSYAYIMPQDRSVDIDSHIEFKLAEIFIENV
jgi:CMP-N-acetylneuraminic acid synthetase